MKYIYISLIIGLFPLSLLAQDITYRSYKTNEYMAELKKDVNTLNKLSQLERDMNKTLRFIEYNFFTVPIVFHVLYENESQMISQEKLAEQVQILNEAFSNGSSESVTPIIQGKDRRNLEGYKLIREDTRVQFCFPAEDPQNKATTGINYESTSTSEWSDYYSMKDKKTGVKPWNTEKYINVWVVNLPDTVSGYAQMPNGPKELDGIVIDYSYISNIGNANSPYNKGYTLAHLMGNYLGLLPLWGSRPCGDDYVDDTPIHNAPNFDCPRVNHVSSCNGNVTEMTNNFMDNTFDACLEMFTAGQMRRIQKVLHPKGPRGKLGVDKKTQCADDLLFAANSREDMKKDEPNSLHKNTINIRPNPVSDAFYVQLQIDNTQKIEHCSIEVYSIGGQLVHQISRAVPQSEFTINVQDWIPGIYVVKAYLGNESFSKRVVVQ